MSEPFVVAGAPAEVALSGDVSRPVRFTVPDLRGRAQHHVEAAFECATSGLRRHSFTGPLLHDVLCAAGPRFDPARRKDRLHVLIAVTGADGHRVVLSWAEIDPEFGRAPVLLATSIDGTRLDLPGPQLVMPQDRCGGRYISGITTIHVDVHYRSRA